jgi:hypothetical protein
MKNTTRTYVLTLNARKGLRLWTGMHLHALRHCSVKQIGLALREMQQGLNALQTPLSSPGRLHHPLGRGPRSTSRGSRDVS